MAPAEGPADGRDSAQMLGDGLVQRLVALAKEADCALELLRVAALLEEAGERQLVQQRGVELGVSLLADDPLEHRPAGDQPADTQPGARRLRERGDVDDVVRRFGAQRPGRLAVEAQVGVDAVLDDEEALAAGQLEQAAAALRREVAPGRVLAVRLQADELDLAPAHELGERVHVEAVGVHRDRQDRGPGRADRAKRPREGRRLDGGDVAGPQQGAGGQVHRLRGAGGGDDLLGGIGEATFAAEDRELLAQLGDALDIAVLVDPRALLGDDLADDPGEALGGEELVGGVADHQRDQVGTVGLAEHLADDAIRVRLDLVRKRVELPGGAVLGLCQGLRRLNRGLAHEGAAADPAGDQAQARPGADRRGRR